MEEKEDVEKAKMWVGLYVNDALIKATTDETVSVAVLKKIVANQEQAQSSG
jgi:hypothetical protein